MFDGLNLSVKQVQSIVQCQARINLWHGSIRSGKTFSSLLAFLMALAVAPSQGLVVITGRTLDTIGRNIMEPLTDPAIVGESIASHIAWNAGAKTATFWGRTVHLVGANDKRAEGKIRGATVCLVYADEATLLPRDFFRQLLGRMSVPGARMFATTNPDNPGHWLKKEFINRAGDLDLRHWHFQLDDNPALDAHYVASLKQEYTGLWYRRFIQGAWVQSDGAVYEMWDEDRHVVDILPQIKRWISLGIDYGTTNPLSGMLLGLGTDGRLYFTHEWRWDSKLQRRQLTDIEYSRRLRGWLGDLPIPHTPTLRGIHPEWWILDPSAASFRVQLHEDGITAKLADNDVVGGIRTVSNLMASDRLRVHRSCKGFIDEVAGYSWDQNKSEAGEDVPVKADDHSVDAGRYAIYTTRAVWASQLREPDLTQAA